MEPRIAIESGYHLRILAPSLLTGPALTPNVTAGNTKLGLYDINIMYINIHTTHALSPKAAEASQIFLRDAHVLPKLFSYE
jgi:hypothetical protein